MFGLKGKRDGFRLLFPKNFLHEEIEKKYSNILKQKHGYYLSPIDLVNESIQKIQVLGISNATIQQNQASQGSRPMFNMNRQKQNEFLYPHSEFNYRSETSPISLTDKTFNVEFRHMLGFLNYFMLFENFWYLYSRDMNYKDLMQTLAIDILDEMGSIYSRIVLYYPMINGIDMLELDYSQPIAASQTFRIEFKYSNFDYEFIDIENNENDENF